MRVAVSASRVVASNSHSGLRKTLRAAGGSRRLRTIRSQRHRVAIGQLPHLLRTRACPDRVDWDEQDQDDHAEDRGGAVEAVGPGDELFDERRKNTNVPRPGPAKVIPIARPRWR